MFKKFFSIKVEKRKKKQKESKDRNHENITQIYATEAKKNRNLWSFCLVRVCTIVCTSI